jgi:hypothetical protein
MGVWLQRVLKKRLLQHYQSSTINTSVTSLFGLEKYLIGISTQEFKAQYGSQSGRSDGASTASNACIPIELWGQRGDWASFKSQKRYLKKDIKSILSFSLAAMDLSSSSRIDIPIDLTLDVRDDSGDSDSTSFDDYIPSMDGIPA